MILKYSVLTLLAMIFITASDPYYGTILTFKPLPPEDPRDVREIPWRTTEAFKSILEDHDNKVSDEFNVGLFYGPMVRFWFFIYTQFDSSQVVFHDKNNLALIYKVLDFSSLHSKGLPKNTLYVLQQKISEEKIKEMKQDILELADGHLSNDSRTRDILEAIQRAGLQVPVADKDRKKFYKSLKDNLRTQTGQRNFIREGIVRSLPYQKFLAKYFRAKKLPKELLAIPFLESSFNPVAQSKVNALGVWQFMPLIASYFVPKRTDHTDYRSNVGVSSISAGFLMAENYQILKSWDLAVTAYNSGTKHLLRTKRKLGKTQVRLDDIIKNSDSRHFGFASQNFYSEFLALAHTLAYEEEIFKALHTHDRHDVDDDLNFYLAKCNMQLDKVLNGPEQSDVKFHNHQLRDLTRPISKGHIITSKSKLPATKFYHISFDSLVNVRPIHWNKFLANQSCSTR